MRNFARLLTFLRPYRRGVIASMVLATLAIVATVAIPWLTGNAIDGLSHHNRGKLEFYALLVLAAAVIRWVLSVSRRLIAGNVSLGVEYDLRKRMFDHLEGLDMSFFDKQQTGQLMSRVTVDLQSVRFFLGYGLVFILQSVLTILVGAGAMILKQPELGLLALSPMPLVVLASMRYSRRSRPALQEVQQRIAELTADAEEDVVGVRVVKAFAAEKTRMTRFRHFVRRVFEQSIYTTRLRAVYNPLLGFVPQLGLGIVLLVGGRQVIHHQLSIGNFTAFYTYVLILTAPLRQLGFALAMAQRAAASGVRVFQILDQEPKIMSPPGAERLPVETNTVEFKDVAFAYEGGAPVIQDVSFKTPGGSNVVMVGPTGSGKSTVVQLLPRLYDVTAGEITIDGADIRGANLESVRTAIAVVTDDPFLFSLSIADNIAYGRPDAPRADVEEAAKIAQADKFIRELPNGYDTVIGERGFTLSAGQRQRIAIARALVEQPRILVLDDATSSLDPSTERKLRDSLNTSGDNAKRTVVSIAHRLAALRDADDILLFEGGRIVARGKHDQLLEKNTLYRNLLARAERDRQSQQVLSEEAARGL